MEKFTNLRVATKSEISENLRASEAGARAGDYVAAIEIGYRSLSNFIRQLSTKQVSPESSLLLRHAMLDARLICENLSMLIVALHEQNGYKLSKSQIGVWRTLTFNDDFAQEFPGFFPVPVTVSTEGDGSAFVQAVERDSALKWRDANSVLNTGGDLLHEGAKLKSAEQYIGFFNQLEAFAKALASLLSSCAVYFGDGKGGRAIFIDFDGGADAQLGCIEGT